MMIFKNYLLLCLMLLSSVSMANNGMSSGVNDPRQIKIIAKIQLTEKMAEKPVQQTEFTVSLITTENTQAIIEKGVEIALQGLPAVNQAASNEFRSAMLRLQIRPSMTQSGHILLQSELQLDEPLQEDYVLFLKRRVFTTNIIKNNSTALVGEIHEKEGEEHLSIKVYLTPMLLEEPL